MTRAARGRVVAFAGGKGGVGKTTLAVNVAAALSGFGKRVGVLDGDLALGNVDVMLGLTPVLHLGHVLDGERALSDILLDGPQGVTVVPAASGVPELSDLTSAQGERLHAVVDQLRGLLDILVIDTPSGISSAGLETVRLADRCLLVTSLDPSAVVDAYATAKALHAGVPTGIVVNGVRNGDEAHLAFRQLELAASRFLTQTLEYFGFVPDDPTVREVSLLQRCVVEEAPEAPASVGIRALAARLAGLGPTPGRAMDLDAALVTEEISRCA